MNACLHVIVCVFFLFFSPSDLINMSRYRPLFNSHLQVFVDRQALPVASDTVDFMLSNNLSVDYAMLQMLLHKLGKQNLWLRAREVFRRKCHFLVNWLAPLALMHIINTKARQVNDVVKTLLSL